MSTGKTLVAHPVLFAIYPVVFFYTRNRLWYFTEVVLLPLAGVTCLALLSLFLLNLILKDVRKAGILLSVSVLLFFTFGHLHNVLLEVFRFAGINSSRPNFIIAVPFIVGVYFAVKVFRSLTHRSLNTLTAALNIAAALLISLNLYSIGTSFANERHNRPEDIDTAPMNIEKTAKLPNIYYIVLDAYAGADILKEKFNFDNSEFIEHLTGKGFYVAGKSKSNYNWTYSSVASSLNLSYLNETDLNKKVEKSGIPLPHVLDEIIQNSKVPCYLKNNGYIFRYAYGGMYRIFHDADALIGSKDYKSYEQLLFIHDMAKYTLYPHLFIWLRGIFNLHITDPVKTAVLDKFGERMLYVLDHLADLPDREAPNFVVAHIYAGHSPFVFGNSGEKPYSGRVNKKATEQYTEQIRVINTKIKSLIDRILSNSTRPSIIILQGDHGPRVATRIIRKSRSHGFPDIENLTDDDVKDLKSQFSILNAYYFPKGNNFRLYDEISPVNTFRVIFNHYFGGRYELLKDESYFITDEMLRYASFINVTRTLREQGVSSQ